MIKMNFFKFINDKTKINFIRLKNGINTGFFAVIIFVLLTTIFQNFIYENVYKNNVSLTITATGQKNEKALASNVRIRDIFVNGSEYDFTKIQLSDGWEYSTVDHLISAYEPTKPVSFNVNFDEDVRMLEIVYVQEVGSGQVEFAINGKNFKTIDTYKDCEWSTSSKVYKVSQLINPYSSYSVFIVLFVLFTIIGYWLIGNNKYYKVFNYLKYLNLSVILAFIIYMLMALMQRESINDVFQWISSYPSNFNNGLWIIVLLNIAVTAIFSKNYRGFLTLSVIGMILLTVSYFKIQFRDVPLLPWDFMLISVAGSVVSRFKLVPSVSFVVALVAFIAIVVLMKFVTKKIYVDKIKLSVRIATLVISAGSSTGLMYCILSVKASTNPLFE